MVDVKSPVGIVGLGTMGRSLVRLCASKGFQVIVMSRTPESGRRGLTKIEAELRSRVDKGKMTREQYDSMLSRIAVVDDPKKLSVASVIIEAIYEDVDAKGKLFRSIEPVLPVSTLLVSNTSSISIEELSSNLKRPSRFLGMHFFNPAEIMKLVEVRRCTKTDDTSANTVSDFARQLGKTPIMTPDLPGLYVNRILFPMLLESISVLETTKSPIAEIDEAMKLGANIPMGPLELCDFIGNDIVLNISRVLLEHTGDLRFKPPKLLEQMVADHKLGRKTGKGFYDYK